MTDPRRVFMLRAVELSRQHMQQGLGGPFGAVVVRGGKVIGEGWNRVTSTNDPTAHAEVTAIREACAHLGTFALGDCEIYTSCEPCPMCLGAIYWARLSRVYFANSRLEAAAIGFDDAHIYQEIAKDIALRQIPMERLEMDEAQKVFAEWAKMPDKIPY